MRSRKSSVRSVFFESEVRMMDNEKAKHIPVLLQEVVDGLDIKSNDRVFEGTVGLGGHSAEIMKHLGPTGFYIGVDRDADALAVAEKRLAHYPCKKIFQEANFRNLDRILNDAGLATVEKILLDIGFSSLQIGHSGRGFSLRHDEPLVMSFAATPEPGALTAREIVNEWAPESLEDILKGYGEEQFARRIAQAIVAAREKVPIETTGQLAEIVRSAVPVFARFGRIHPATKTFQAIRITVNDELGALREALVRGFERLSPHGRIAIISFHSLEDRAVKTFFREQVSNGRAFLVHKKPIVPKEEEILHNPRARSAKLRIMQKISNHITRSEKTTADL